MTQYKAKTHDIDAFTAIKCPAKVKAQIVSLC